MEKNTALLNLEEAAASIMQAERAQTNAAIEAREAGASWEEIGQRLGITKQRAHQRYNEAARDERAARYAAAEARGKAKGEKILEEITTKVWKTTKPETSKIVDEDRAGQSVTPSIFLEPMRNPAGQLVDYASKKVDPIAPAKVRTPAGTIELGPKDFGTEMPKTDTWTEPRKHGAILPGPKPKSAQPGTGKGPHLCPGCQSTNHHGSKRNTIVWNDGCIPTKYDPQATADFMNARKSK